MPKRFLNVEYSGTRTRINVTDFEDLSEVQDAVKVKMPNALSRFDSPHLQLFDQQGQQINTWALFNSLPQEYFVEGGLSLTIRTSPPPSREISKNELFDAGSTAADAVSLKRKHIEIEAYTSRLKSFANAQLVEGCIQSQGSELFPYPPDEIKKLYVRKCYQDVFNSLLDHVNVGSKLFAISGTPGIGKSLFFIYILHHLMNDFGSKTLPLKPNRIVYHRASDYTCFDLEKQTGVELGRKDAKSLVQQQDTFYIVDGRTSQPHDSSCVVLFISSPCSKFYKDFVNKKTAKEWYFPVWTLEELEICQRYCYPDLSIEMLKERHRIFGGVARFVFYKDNSIRVPTIMEETLADVDAVKGVRNIGNPTRIFETSHTLLHIRVSSDGLYHFTHVDIASEYVGEQLWIRYAAQMITNLQEMFGGSPNEISRHLFEIYGHMVFSAGGRTLRCKCLESNDDAVTDFTLYTLNSQRITFGKDRIPTAQDLEGKYYEPTDDNNFPAIDSLSTQGMFQFTVGAEHPIRGVQVLRKLCKLYKEPKLYFVVPPHRFKYFKKQSFKPKEGKCEELKQYVLELPVGS